MWPSLRAEAPGRAPRSPGRELLGPSGSHHLWGQADSVVIEQSVLGLTPSHPPLKDFYGPSACDHIPQKTGNRSIKVTPLPSWQRKKNTEIKGQKERKRETRRKPDKDQERNDEARTCTLTNQAPLGCPQTWTPKCRTHGWCEDSKPWQMTGEVSCIHNV